MEFLIISLALSLLMKHLVIGQRQKAPNFSAFHWSPHGSLVSIDQHFVTMRVVHLPKRAETSNSSAFHWSLHGSLVSIGQHFVTTRVVHLPKRTETSLNTESDRSDVITESDQAVRAVHSSNSWLL